LSKTICRSIFLFLLLAALVVVSPVAAAAKLAISVVDGVAPADSESSERMLTAKAVKILCATRRVFETVCKAVFSASVHVIEVCVVSIVHELITVDPDGVEDTAVVQV
jgi:hypothetical protein